MWLYSGEGTPLSRGLGVISCPFRGRGGQQSCQDGSKVSGHGVGGEDTPTTAIGAAAVTPQPSEWGQGTQLRSVHQTHQKSRETQPFPHRAGPQSADHPCVQNLEIWAAALDLEVPRSHPSAISKATCSLGLGAGSHTFAGERGKHFLLVCDKTVALPYLFLISYNIRAQTLGPLSRTLQLSAAL